MDLREIFYGGRTEVFAPYCDVKALKKEVKYIDVCSLYPFVCSFKELPIGYPEVFFAYDIDKTRFDCLGNNPNRYWGYARIKIRPKKDDILGLLPQRLDGKLQFNLLEKIGVWHTELIYLAMRKGYELLEVYEVYHWPPNKRSDKLMRGYMEFFLRMKQEAEGWEKLGPEVYPNKRGKDWDSLTEEEKDNICEFIYKQNGNMARPRKECVEKNPVKRQLAKIFLNCLWGKLAQKNPTEVEEFIYGLDQYLKLMNNPTIDQDEMKLRHVSGCTFKARYKKLNKKDETGKFVNLFIAASVTAHAMVYLMSQMYNIGPENVLYCDTDSIVYLKDTLEGYLTSSGLGNWTDEFGKNSILKFIAIAPKSYAILLDDDELLLKCKGVKATPDNRRIMTFEKLLELLMHHYIGIGDANVVVDSMTITPNSTSRLINYGELTTTYNNKRVQIVISKRELRPLSQEIREEINKENIYLIRSYPIGYEGELIDIYEL